MKKSFTLQAVILVLGVSFAAATQTVMDGCVPTPFPPITDDEMVGEISNVLRASDGYQDIRQRFSQEAQEGNLGSDFLRRVEDTTIRFLVSDAEGQSRYVRRVTTCLVDNGRLRPDEKRAIDGVFQALAQQDAQGAIRARERLGSVAVSDLGKTLSDRLGFLAEEDEPETYESGRSTGKAIGAVLGAVIGGFGSGTIPGAILGAAVGSAIGEAIGEAVDEYRAGGTPGEDGGGEGGDTGQGN